MNEPSVRDAEGAQAHGNQPPHGSISVSEMVRPLVLASAALLGIGLVAPSMTILTSFGRYEGWVKLLAPEMAREQQSTYSLLGGIIAIMEHGNALLGLLLLAFSCVFPTLKLMLMAWANEAVAQGRAAGRLFRLAHHAGKFSMLDVMVLALLVIAIKGLPGGSELRLRWGVWAFAGSVVLSLLISLLLHRVESGRERPQSGPEDQRAARIE
jgi:paraquat-inducible protein A